MLVGLATVVSGFEPDYYYSVEYYFKELCCLGLQLDLRLLQLLVSVLSSTVDLQLFDLLRLDLLVPERQRVSVQLDLELSVQLRSGYLQLVLFVVFVVVAVAIDLDLFVSRFCLPVKLLVFDQPRLVGFLLVVLRVIGLA